MKCITYKYLLLIKTQIATTIIKLCKGCREIEPYEPQVQLRSAIKSVIKKKNTLFTNI